MSERPLDVLENALSETVVIHLKDGETYAGVLAGYDRCRNPQPRQEEHDDAHEVSSLRREVLPHQKESLLLVRLREVCQAPRLRVAVQGRRVATTSSPRLDAR